MEQMIRDEIRRFVLESPDNRFPEGDQPYFDEPLVGFAAADDPLFTQYKTIIGEFHMTPAEIMEDTYGPGIGKASTVICWILPITRETRESNRREERMPSLGLGVDPLPMAKGSIRCCGCIWWNCSDTWGFRPLPRSFPACGVR